MNGTAGMFQLVEGQVTSTDQADGQQFIELGGNGRRGFSAVIAPEDRRAFRDFDLEELPALHIRVRDVVQGYRGRFEIVLSTPSQIEVLN